VVGLCIRSSFTENFKYIKVDSIRSRFSSASVSPLPIGVTLALPVWHGSWVETGLDEKCRSDIMRVEAGPGSQSMWSINPSLPDPPHN
jgi:hypothetical protein